MQSSNAVVCHYSSFWGEPTGCFRWTAGPIEGVCPGFRVVRLQKSSGVLVFATVGMSTHADRASLETHILAKPELGDDDQDSLVELLAAVAHYHVTGRRLDVGHTVDFGRGWLAKSPSSCGLLSRPYLDGPLLEWMDRPRVRCLWLIPIWPIERDLSREQGSEELEQRFETEQVDLLDPLRPSVV